MQIAGFPKAETRLIPNVVFRRSVLLFLNRWKYEFMVLRRLAGCSRWYSELYLRWFWCWLLSLSAAFPVRYHLSEVYFFPLRDHPEDMVDSKLFDSV